MVYPSPNQSAPQQPWQSQPPAPPGAVPPPPGFGPPGWPPPPPPPPPSNRSTWVLASVVGVAALLISVAVLILVPDSEPASGTVAEPQALPGVDDQTEFAGTDCRAEPNTCYAGPRIDGGELTFGMTAYWNGWNSQRWDGGSGTAQALAGIFPGTGRYLPDGTWEWSRDLLAEPPTLTSDSPQSWQYVLNPDAAWDDGTPIGVDDFVWHWYHNSDDPNKCGGDGCEPYAPNPDIASVTESGPGTVEVTLVDGVTDPEWMSYQGLSYPAHVATDQGYDWQGDPVDMAASSRFFADTVPTFSGGPYRVVEATLFEQVVLEPNTEWFGQTAATLDRLTRVQLGSSDMVEAALQTGEVDGADLSDLPMTDIGPILDQTDQAVAAGPGSIWEHLDVNTGHDALSDAELRRAIFTAVDVDQLVDASLGDIVDWIEPRTSYLFNEVNNRHADVISATGFGGGDTAAAQAILDDAGIDPGDIDPLRIRFTEGNTSRTIMAEFIADQLAGIGIDTELVPIPPAELGTVLAAQDYELVIFGWQTYADFDDGPYHQWHSEGGSNFGGFSNAEVDALAEAMLATTSIDEATELGNQASALVAEHAYVLPIVTRPHVAVFPDEFVNIRVNGASPLGSQYNCEEWGLRQG